MAELVKTAEKESTIVIGRFQTSAQIMLGEGHNNPELDPTLEMTKRNGKWQVWLKNHGAAFGFSMKVNNNGIVLESISKRMPSDGWFPYTRYRPTLSRDAFVNKIILEAHNYQDKKLGRIEISGSEMKIGNQRIIFESVLPQKRS